MQVVFQLLRCVALLGVFALGVDIATINVAWAGDIRLAQAGGGFTPDVTGAPSDSAGLATRQLGGSAASRRVALVVGNSNYTKLPNLANPSNDARLMEQTLRKVGFEVVSAIDADRRTIARAVRKFGRALRAGDKDAVGLFYFAGHGVQARGVNYFIPLGADIEDEADLDIEAVSAADILSQMETAGNALNLVILDACRNNPFKGKLRSASRGLARVQAASGSLVAFAAAPGQVAADGEDANSPYTKALVKAMQVPGLSVEKMFKQVRVSVEAQTGNRQTPWEESSLRGDFYFVPAKTEPAADAPVAAQQPTIQKIDPKAMELSFWNSIQSADRSEYFETYLSRYPNGIFAEIARLRSAEFNKKVETGKEPIVEKNGPRTPATDEAANGKPDKVDLASLPPPDASPTLDQQSTVADDSSKRELAIAVQRELNRLGCEAGAADGQWGKNSSAALKRYGQHGNFKLATLDPSPGLLNDLKGQPSRVCPRSDISKFNGTWKFTKRASNPSSCAWTEKSSSLSIIKGTVVGGDYKGQISINGSIKFTQTFIFKGERVQNFYTGIIQGTGARGKFGNPRRKCRGTFTLTKR